MPSVIARPSAFTTAARGPSASTSSDDRRLVPNANEQAALKHGRGMQANGDSLRSIAFVWMSEFGLGQYDAKTVQRILAREDTASRMMAA
jgi:hypothetical protein